MLSVGRSLEGEADTIGTREGDAVTAPVDFNPPLLQGEEEDQSRNGDGAEGGGGGDAESSLVQNSQSAIGGVTYYLYLDHHPK